MLASCNQALHWTPSLLVCSYDLFNWLFNCKRLRIDLGWGCCVKRPYNVLRLCNISVLHKNLFFVILSSSGLTSGSFVWNFPLPFLSLLPEASWLNCTSEFLILSLPSVSACSSKQALPFVSNSTCALIRACTLFLETSSIGSIPVHDVCCFRGCGTDSCNN